MGRNRHSRRYSQKQAKASWEAYLVMAAITFVLLRWVVPATVFSKPMWRGLAQLSVTLGTMGAGLLAVLALLAYIAQRAERRTSAFSDELKPISLDAYRREPRAQSSATDFSALDVAWGQAYQSNQHRSRQKPTEWSLEVLRSIEWKRFEELCAALFREQGSRAETQVCGPDGGIDIHVYGSDPVSPLTIVQCKAWNNQQIGVNLIRELLGVMTHTKVGHGMFMTTSTFSEDAVAFAQANNIALLSGQAVLKEIVELPADAQARLLSVATEGDYMTPTCASCGIKMVWRDKGQFWGCVNYPRCSSRLFSKAV